MRDTPTMAQYLERPQHPARNLIASFLMCIVAAVLVGLLFDRVGLARTAALIAGAVIVMLGLRDFRIFAVLVVFLLPFVPIRFLSQAVAGLSGLRIVGLAILMTAAAVFIAVAVRPGQLRFPAWRPIFLAYLLVFVVAALDGARSVSLIPAYFNVLGVFSETTALGYLQVMLFSPGLVIVASYVMALLAANTRRPAWVTVPVLASAVLLAALLCLVATGTSSTVDELAQQESRRHLSVLGPHANELGLVLNMALALALCSLGQARSRGAALWLGAGSLVLAAGILLTFSRGAFLGLLVVMVYAVLVRRKGGWLPLVLVALALAVAAMSDAVVGRALHGIGGNDIDLISSGRVNEIWRPLLPEIARHPLFGSGHASILWSEAAQTRSILPVGHPHSAYLASLLDVGIAGSIITLVFFVHMWRLFLRVARAGQAHGLRGFFLGAAACIPLLLVQGITDDSFMPGFTHVYLWLAYGAATGISARRDRIPAPYRRAEALERPTKDIQ